MPNLNGPHVWASWAWLNRHTHTTVTGGSPGPSTTESMIKVAIGAGFLHNLELHHRQPTTADRRLLTDMIQVSDNDAAETLYLRAGGQSMLRTVITTCDLTGVQLHPGWGDTTMTPATAARMGACIADGKVAGPPAAAWLLDQMRQVHGPSRFGIIDARPADDGVRLAIKNGYLERGDAWHVNCLAIAPSWTMEIMVRYPAGRGLTYGAHVCRDIAAAILPPQTTTPASPTGSTGAA